MELTSIEDLYRFEDTEEEQIKEIREAVKERADYNLRQIISIAHDINKKVSTGEKNEYGDTIEDWDKISTKELINLFSAGIAWNYYSTPVRMQAFIESSLSDIIYKYKYNTIISDDTLKGTVAAKTATAEIETQQEKFVAKFRELYTTYVTESLKAFDTYLRRLEKVIEWRLAEERATAKSPF